MEELPRGWVLIGPSHYRNGGTELWYEEPNWVLYDRLTEDTEIVEEPDPIAIMNGQWA